MLLQPRPNGFEDHQYQFSFPLNASNDQVWAWLNNTHTFTDTQYWPYRVEFYSPDPANIPNGFYEGVLTNHHGPLISFAGQLVKVKTGEYRDLQYFYGSYALNFNWIRPYRLEFWTENSAPNTIIRCKISTYVRPWMLNTWDRSQRLFWKRFENWATKSIQRKPM